MRLPLFLRRTRRQAVTDSLKPIYLRLHPLRRKAARASCRIGTCPPCRFQFIKGRPLPTRLICLTDAEGETPGTAAQFPTTPASLPAAHPSRLPALLLATGFGVLLAALLLTRKRRFTMPELPFGLLGRRRKREPVSRAALAELYAAPQPRPVPAVPARPRLPLPRPCCSVLPAWLGWKPRWTRPHACWNPPFDGKPAPFGMRLPAPETRKFSECFTPPVDGRGRWQRNC